MLGTEWCLHCMQMEHYEHFSFALAGRPPTHALIFPHLTLPWKVAHSRKGIVAPSIGSSRPGGGHLSIGQTWPERSEVRVSPSAAIGSAFASLPFPH